jgi:peroxiredoxin
MTERPVHEANVSTPARQHTLFSNAFVSVLLALSVIVNVALARKLSIQNRLVSSLYSSSRLQTGDAVPDIVGYAVDGHEQTLKYSEVNVPTVLYVFTPQCGWCRKNIENLRALINNSGTRYRVVGISLTSVDLAAYLDHEHLVFPVYTGLTDATKAAYKLGGTPTTIIVSPNSTVLKAWSGVYEEPVRTEIQGFLKVRLPGCCTESLAQVSR